MSYITISVLCGLAVFLLCLILFSKQKKQTLHPGKEKMDKPDEWLYSNFLEKLYDALFPKSDPTVLSKKLGLEYDKYMINCNIIGKKPNFKRECMLRIIGFSLLLFGCLGGICFGSLIPIAIGMLAYILGVSFVTHGAEKAAKAKKEQLVSELIRFSDLLHAALEVNLPLEVAIEEVAENMPGILSAEMKKSLAEVQLGAKTWQHALEDIAHKYEVDMFSDFVLDIITSHNKGVSVADAVARKAYAIRQSSLLRAKEKTAKMSTSILIPITIFKILPLLAIMLIPVAICTCQQILDTEIKKLGQKERTLETGLVDS